MNKKIKNNKKTLTLTKVRSLGVEKTPILTRYLVDFWKNRAYDPGLRDNDVLLGSENASLPGGGWH